MPSAPTSVRAGLLAFVALVALQHPLRPDLPATDHFISEYARGSTQPLQVAAFVAWAVATGACAAVAARAGRHRRIARAVAVAALALATAGLLLAAAFTTQTVAGELPEDVRRTAAGRLHDLGTLGILAGLLVAALASLRLVPRAGYRLAVAGLGVALLGIVPVLMALGLDAPGIGQRGFILVGCAWQWTFAGASRSSVKRVGPPA